MNKPANPFAAHNPYAAGLGAPTDPDSEIDVEAAGRRGEE